MFFSILFQLTRHAVCHIPHDQSHDMCSRIRRIKCINHSTSGQGIYFLTKRQILPREMNGQVIITRKKIDSVSNNRKLSTNPPILFSHYICTQFRNPNSTKYAQNDVYGRIWTLYMNNMICRTICFPKKTPYNKSILHI